MNCRKKLCAFAAATGMICLLVVVSNAPVSSSPTPQAAPLQAQGLKATVGAVDTKARTLEMITGVGHALRLVRMQVEPTCHILVAGAPAQLADLKRGNIILIQYRRTAERNLAEHIETFHLPSPGEKR